ncbi:MAG: YdgA family protein [Desulfobulbaceae bacterium]|nr:YdgA family protein [Desulfobulbaceae bacterium]
MKKIVVAVLLLIIIAGVGAPFVSGLMMEKIVKQAFSNLNTMYSETGSDVSIEMMQYDRKIFSTEIEWKMRLGSLKAVYGVEEIIFIDRAEHGFTGIVSRTSLEKNGWFTEFVDSKLDGKNPLAITTEYKISGEILSTIGLDAFSLPVEGEVVEIKAGKAVLACDKELKDFFSEASWEGLLVSEKLKVEGISIISSLEKISTYLWNGTVSFKVDKSEFAGKFEQVELVNFKGDYTLAVNEEENTISVMTTIGADHLVTGLEKIDNGFVRIGLINMDVQGFEEFMKLYTEMANTVLKEITVAEDDPEEMKTIFQEQMSRTQFQMMTAYESLLKKGLEFQISDLHAGFPSGEVKGDAVLSLNKDMTFAQFIPLIHQPELVVDVFSLQSNVTLPAELVGDNPMLLSPIYSGMQSGFFVKDGENLVHKAETRDSKLYLNGLEVKFN